MKKTNKTFFLFIRTIYKRLLLSWRYFRGDYEFWYSLLSRDLLQDFPAVCSVSLLSIVRLRISEKAFCCGICWIAGTALGIKSVYFLKPISHIMYTLEAVRCEMSATNYWIFCRLHKVIPLDLNKYI